MAAGVSLKLLWRRGEKKARNGHGDGIAVAIAISSSVRFASPRPPPLFAKHPAAIFANAVAANPEKSHARQLRRKEKGRHA